MRDLQVLTVDLLESASGFTGRRVNIVLTK